MNESTGAQAVSAITITPAGLLDRSTRSASTTSFWSSDRWENYERTYGDEPGTRAQLLAAATWDTIVVDLTPDKSTLWKHIRKSFHALIHRAESSFDIGACYHSACYPNKPCPWVVRFARDLHHQSAGRETRSKKTWELMGEWCADGDGMIIVASPKAPEPMVPVAFAYFAIHDGWSLYFSSAATVRNVNHALIWHGMKALKARGVRELELGWAARDGDTDKDRGITKFKSGFGGVLCPAGEGVRCANR